MVSYIKGSDLPDQPVVWTDYTNALIDFGLGWTFQLKIGHLGQAALVVKTSGITGFGPGISPNVVIAWAISGELNTLEPGNYTALLTATRTSDNKQRRISFPFNISAEVM